MSQHNLLFLNPVHEAGLNVTVRLGTKWKERVSKGDIVKIVKTDEEERPLGFGVIREAMVCPFHSIPQDALQFEHDPSCRNKEGLAKAMERAYGSGFAADAEVTILRYDFQPVIPPFLTKVIADMIAERGYQESRWTQDFDDKNTLNDWITYVNIYMGRGAEMGLRGHVNEQRTGLLKAATILLSALFCCDKNDGFAPRHYEYMGRDCAPADKS